MGDPILFWNKVALDANRESQTNGKGEQTGPTLSARALAIVHLAMYDAFVGTSPGEGLTRYDPVPPAPAPPASFEAAIAAAAHTTLSALFPSQRAFFNAKLAEVTDRSEPGFQFGIDVAQTQLNNRKGDPDAKDVGYVPPTGRGKHRVDPDNPGQGFYGPYYGSAPLFATTQRYELEPPPPLNDDRYTNALREVRELGIAPELIGTLPAGSTPRDANQTVIGIFWGYDGRPNLGTPPRLYNQIVRRIAENRGNTVAENARLFALVNVAMADAGILAWEQKYKHNLWRPVLGVREQDPATGPSATAGTNTLDPNCDMSWLPLGGPSSNPTTLPSKNFTPNFPAYPSGHATFGAAAFHITRLFYDENLVNDRNPDELLAGMEFESDEFNDVTTDNRGTIRPRHLRTFPGGLWEMIEENGLSRVYLGVHWHFDAFAYVAEDEPENKRENEPENKRKNKRTNKEEKKQPDYNQNIGGVPLGLAIAEDIFKHRLTKEPQP